MKKVFYLSMLALVGLVACSKAEQDAPVVEEPVVNPVTSRTVTLIASSSLSDNDTKAVFTDGTGFAWEADDLTNVGISQSGSNVCTKAGGSIDTDGNAILKADVADGNFYAYFPYNSSAAGSFEMAASQTTAAGAFSGIKLASDEIAISSETTEASVQFHVAGHLLRFYVYDSEGSTESVQKVTVSADKTLAGTYTYDFASATGSVTAGGTTSVTATLSSPLSLSGKTSAAGTTSIFVPIAAVSDAIFTYSVTTAENVYTFTSASAKSREEGKVTEVKLNLSNANAVPTAKEDVYWFFRNHPGSVNQASLSLGNAASNNYIGYFFANIGGDDDGHRITAYTTHEIYNSFRFEAVDGVGGSADWLTFRKTGDNSLYIDAEANEDADSRSATLNVYFDGDVTNYKGFYTDGNSIALDAPILSMPVTQAGKPAITTLVYEFKAKGIGAPVVKDISYSAASNVDLGWYAVSVNGVSNGDGTQPWFQSLRFTSDAAWASMSAISNQNRLQYSVQANDGEARTATLYAYFNGNPSDYTVAGTDGIDGTNTVITDFTTEPVFKLVINQAAVPTDKTGIVFDFFRPQYSTAHQLKGNNFMTYEAGGTISANGGTYGTGGRFAVYEDGTDDAAMEAGTWSGHSGYKPYFTNISGKGVDPSTGAELDWVEEVSIRSGQDKIQFTLKENTSGSPRSAKIQYFFDGDPGYKVVGTYVCSDSQENWTITSDAITTNVSKSEITDPSTQPILEFIITQPAK